MEQGAEPGKTDTEEEGHPQHNSYEHTNNQRPYSKSQKGKNNCYTCLTHRRHNVALCQCFEHQFFLEQDLKLTAYWNDKKNTGDRPKKRSQLLLTVELRNQWSAKPKQREHDPAGEDIQPVQA